jgi:dTDP-glucose pyrophosphorylase
MDEIKINKSTSILEALKRMDELGKKLLVITEGDQFINVLSIGDIQRAIINNFGLDTAVNDITRSIITVASTNDSIEKIREQMIALRTEFMPVVSPDGLLEKLIFWEELFEQKDKQYNPIDLPVIIMAGGFGKRLKPFTNVLPKPLIPFGDKTMIETIIESFRKHNCQEFHLSVNYKAELIEFYLNENYKGDNDLQLNYFREQQPLGTAGSLHLLRDKIDSTFFVSNCDILVEQDYAEIRNYHVNNKNELTVVAALKHFSIPYGTLETGEEGILTSITEKPEQSYLINSGLYILEPHLLKDIPENKFYHITTLINDLMQQNRRVGVFPVSEKSWKDVGEWKEFYKNIES